VSVVRIFFNPLDAKSKVEYPIAPGTQLIDFLQKEYPYGFDGVLRVFIGIEELAIDDLDYVVQENEQITMLVMPGITLAMVGTYLIQALVAFAIGYVINLIFGPEVPGAPNAPEESSVYSLSPTRNSARLGEPIEVIYGTVSYPPSFASVPYAFFAGESNDQYVDELLCLGQGYFTDISIMIGDTPVGIMAPGTVQYWIYGPDDHNSTGGVIESEIAALVASTAAPFPFWENCFTSPEVDNYEFSKEVTDSVETGSLAGNAFAQTTNGAGGIIAGRIEGVSSSISLQPGDVVTLSGTTSNNITFTVGSIVRTGATMTLFQRTSDAGQLANESPLTPSPVYSRAVQTDGQIAGPFRCQKLGQPINRVICDFVFPQGIYDVDGSDGDIIQSYVTMEISVQQVNEDTNAPIGAPVVVEKTTYGRSPTPVRTSIESGLLPEGAYEVTVTYKAGWGGERTTGEATLVGIRGIVVLDTTPGATYGPVTLLAIRMKATQGLAAAARSRIRVTATRVLDPLDLTVLGNNPMTAVKDVWMSTEYGLGRPLSELDPHVTELETEWSIGDGPFVNGAFDQRGTGYEAMGRIAAAVAGKVVNNGGLTDVVIERSQDTRVALFNAATIIKDSLSITYNFDTNGDYDGIEAAYSDPETFEARYAYYPTSPLPEYPDTYNLWGITDSVYAQQMARYLDNVKANRRKLVRFETELDGWLVAFGDRIGVSFPMPLWGESGVIVEVISPTEVRVDKNLDWALDKVVMLRDSQGRPDGPYTVTQGATPNIIVFDAVPGITLHDMDAREPTSYVYGLEESMIMDFVVARVTPKGGSRFEIEAQTYSELIYNGAPPHMRPLTSASELLYFGTTYSNTPDSHPQIVASADGQIIVLNRRGSAVGTAGAFAYSTNGGVSFSTSSAGSSPGGNIRSLQYDYATGRVWADEYNSGQTDLYYSDDNGATWTEYPIPAGVGMVTNFVKSFGLTAAGEIIYLATSTNYDGTPNATRVTKHSSPPGDTSYIRTFRIDPSFDGTVNEIHGWRGYELMPGSNRILLRADADNTLLGPQNPWYGFFCNISGWSDGALPGDPGLGLLFLDNKFTSIRGNAYNKNGNMIQLRSHAINVSTFDSIAHDYSGTSPFPTFTVDWGLPVKNVCMTYSGTLGGYVLSAEDTFTVGGRLHLRYNTGTDFSIWSKIPSVRLSRFPVDYNARQLYWSHDNVYIYGYFTTGTVSVFDKITINEPAPIPFTGVLVHNHLDSKVGNDYPSAVGNPFNSVLPLYTPSKYGPYAMGYNQTNGAQLVPSASMIVEDFTVRAYYKPLSYETTSPRNSTVWMLGQLLPGQLTDIIQLYVDYTRTLRARCIIGGATKWSVAYSTPLAVAPAPDYYEIELEVCRETDLVTLFLDGAVVDQQPLVQRYQKWVGSNDMYLAAGPFSTNNVRYSRGPIDEVQVVNRSIWKGAAHPPSTGPYS